MLMKAGFRCYISYLFLHNFYSASLIQLSVFLIGKLQIKDGSFDWVMIACIFNFHWNKASFIFSILGPWSIHRGTPRNRPKCVLSCTGDAPEGASSGIQILPSSFDRACHLSKLFLDRSLLWLGIQQAVSSFRVWAFFQRKSCIEIF